ncbi:immunity protein TriTu family protein [Chitiniphilus eburneus]|uniref:Uncharacterized protein n=1 Tax=Chitiniphilus eburneus TaxID=2571148 RepID=A0A4V5MRH3_9NEIS|nr:hypothetical protein [Chitiniphilus eburneus]TJZ76338.1 hypothetical protein FAZ21_06080 [Chitiniphilus eburneus]
MDLNEFVDWWEKNKKNYPSIEESEITFSPKEIDESLRVELDGIGLIGRITLWGRGDFVLEILDYEDASDLYTISGFMESVSEIEGKFSDFFSIFESKKAG